jgi:UDP-N-acetylmuramate dehydrogenase
MLIRKNFNLTEYNSYRLKSIAETVIFPENTNDIVEIFKNKTTKPIVLGGGNNIILSKKYYNQVFVVLNGCFDKVEVTKNLVIAEAGATMLRLSEEALKNSLSGLEIFYDIPSSVGGAVVMNAGNDEEEIKNLLVKVEYLDLVDMKVKTMTCDEVGFEYRNSYFQKNTDNIVLKAWFRLSTGNKKAIKNKMETIKEKRWSKQPRNYPNCGSVFKRPEHLYVGPMLDNLQLKGFSIGGAQVSKKHSGFIVNTGNGTGEDILAVIKKVKEQVEEKFKVKLEVEQRII